jgi:hypothetical protein
MPRLWVEVDSYTMDYTTSTECHLTSLASCREKRWNLVHFSDMYWREAVRSFLCRQQIWIFYGSQNWQEYCCQEKKKSWNYRNFSVNVTIYTTWVLLPNKLLYKFEHICAETWPGLRQAAATLSRLIIRPGSKVTTHPLLVPRSLPHNLKKKCSLFLYFFKRNTRGPWRAIWFAWSHVRRCRRLPVMSTRTWRRVVRDIAKI